jgi:hypothetical protein
MDSQPAAPGFANVEPQAAAVSPQVEAAAQINSGVSVEILSTALLNIVSDKTGYPVETLEMDMDMEADLGIDSIKRVEILGAMQTQFPNYQKLITPSWQSCAL